MKKSFIATLIGVVFCCTISVSAASLPDTNTVTNNELPQSTIDEVDLLFNNKDHYTIKDEAGNDITQKFFDRYDENYVNGEIKFIMEEMCEQHLTICEPIVYTTNGNTTEKSLKSGQARRGIILTRTATQPCSVPVEGTYWVKFDVQAEYRVYDYNNQIESASAPQIVESTIHSNLSTRGYAYHVFNSGGYADIRADRTQVKFIANYRVEVFVKIGIGYVHNFPGTNTFYAS